MKEKKIARDTRNREKLAGDDWVMAEFYATWCPHCQRMQPLIKEFKKEMEGIVEVVQVDVDKEKSISQLFNVKSIPVMVFIPRDGKPFTVVGLRPQNQIEQIIQEKLDIKK